MSITARLQLATRNLSPLQRITLILKANREGREPDPDLRDIADPQQERAFRRYMALLYTSNAALGARCDALAVVAGDLDIAADQVRLLCQAASLLEEEHGLSPPRRVRDWHRPGEMEINEFLRSLARELQESLVRTLALRWQEMKAVELLWDELAGEFAGEDPVEPQFRDKLAEVAALLRSLAAEMHASRRLVEPDDAILAEARKAVDDAFERLEPLL